VGEETLFSFRQPLLSAKAIIGRGRVSSGDRGRVVVALRLFAAGKTAAAKEEKPEQETV